MHMGGAAKLENVYLTKVTLSKKELIELLYKVNDLNPKALLKKHRDIIEGRKGI